MNEKGFTILEVLIVFVIACILALIVFSGIRGKSSDNYKVDCDAFQYTSVKDLPAACLNYYNVKPQ